MPTIRYGLEFQDGISLLDIELWCYRHDTRPENGPEGRLSRFEHFRRAVDMELNVPGSSRTITWNEWTDDMITAMIEHKYTGLAGAGSSGKSDAAALFAIFDWMSAPTETMFLVCSSTLAGARGRIWKSISEIWGALEAKWTHEGKSLPGKIIPSQGRIVGLDVNGKWSESIGVWLIAAGKDDQAEADKKLKGLKAPTGGVLRLIADEFSDLGMCVFTAMVGNLSSTPGFKGIGMANPGSKNTPFGRFVKPKSGWKSLSLGMTRWATEYGICLSFDAYYSPRIKTPQHERTLEDGSTEHALYNWMASAEHIEQSKTTFGEDSLEFWAQIRGMFCPTGMETSVWSEIELLNAEKPVGEDEWDVDSPVTVARFGGTQLPRAAALDPGFTTGGDRSPIMWAEFGRIKGVKTMNILGLRIASEVPSESEDGSPISEEDQITVSENVINQFQQLCIDNSIPPHHAGFDATGGGTVFGQWLRTKWSGNVHGVRFGEKPKERRADSHEAEIVYENRVTQLWVQPKALVRMGQIRGIPHDVVEEMCLRRWHPKKNTGAKTCVEEKKEMKKRTGKSPDLGDTFCILVDVAITMGLLDVQEIRQQDRKINQAWQQAVATKLYQGTPVVRKSIVAMPQTKRLKR